MVVCVWHSRGQNEGFGGRQKERDGMGRDWERVGSCRRGGGRERVCVCPRCVRGIAGGGGVAGRAKLLTKRRAQKFAEEGGSVKVDC